LPRLTWQVGGELRSDDATEKSLYNSLGLVNQVTYRIPGLGSAAVNWDRFRRTYRDKASSGSTNDTWGFELQGPSRPLCFGGFYRGENGRPAVSRHRYQQRWIGAELHWRGGKKSSVGILYLYRPKRFSSPARVNDRRRIDQRETLRLEFRHRLTPDLTARL